MEQSEIALYHHGILGQKWGVRRYQNEDGSLTEDGRKRYGVGYGVPATQTFAKRYQTDLNRLDKERAKHVYDYEVANNKAKRAEEKYYERLVKKDGKVDAKAQKFLNKRDERINAGKAALDLIRTSETSSWNLMANAVDGGYSVSSKKIHRDVKLGERVAATYIGGPIGLVSYSVISTATSNHTGIVEGNKYKVKVY